MNKQKEIFENDSSALRGQQQQRPPIQGPSESDRCACGAIIYNGHHCANGHMQNR